MTTQYEVLDALEDHPNWSSVEIANALGCSSEYVRATLRRRGRKLHPHDVAGRRRELMNLGWAAKAAGLTLADLQRIAERRKA